MVDRIALSPLGDEVETEDYLFTRYEQQNGHNQVILGRKGRYEEPEYVIKNLSGEEAEGIMEDLKSTGEEVLEEREDVKRDTRSTDPVI